MWAIQSKHACILYINYKVCIVLLVHHSCIYSIQYSNSWLYYLARISTQYELKVAYMSLNSSNMIHFHRKQSLAWELGQLSPNLGRECQRKTELSHLEWRTSFTINVKRNYSFYLLWRTSTSVQRKTELSYLIWRTSTIYSTMIVIARLQARYIIIARICSIMHSMIEFAHDYYVCTIID
jgi:hypothetical protein